MEFRELLPTLSEALEDKYKELGIESMKIKRFDEKNSSTFFSDITRTRNNIRPFPYSDFKIHDEFIFLNEDLLFSIGWLHLLKDNINNSISEGGRYNQTYEDHLYLRYANYGFQVIYNFWDRIADTLHLFFETGLKDDAIYIGKLLNNFPAAYRTKNYLILLDIYKTYIKPLLETRNNVVHHFGLKTHHFWSVIEAGDDFNKIELLQKEKDEYVNLFINQLQLFNDGFYYMIKLIEDLPEKVK